MSDGLNRLIDPWMMTVPVDGGVRTQHFPPLVDWLAALVTPSNNSRGGGGSPATRNIADFGALDLKTHIEDVTWAWLEEWDVRRAGELKLDLRGYWDKLTTLHTSGAMDDDTYEHLASYPDTWAAKIWDLIEPPKQVPLRSSECPKCGESKMVNQDGESSDNLLITLRVGHELTAECRNRECAAVWIGREGLVELGRAIGVEIDFDTLMEVVAELG